MKTDLPKVLLCPHPVADKFNSQVQSLVDSYAVESAAAPPSPRATEPAPTTATAIATGYSHAAMVGLMLAHPEMDHKSLAAHWGRNSAWFASVLASDAFQLELDKVRHLIPDPYITATMEERFRALTLGSLTVLQGKLDSKEVADATVLKAAEIGVKALGMGQIASPPVAPTTSVESLADRLVSALEKQRKNVRTVDAEVVVIPEPTKGTEDGHTQEALPVDAGQA